MSELKNNIAFYPRWCSEIAADVYNVPGAKRRFLAEYDKNVVLYRVCAKEVMKENVFPITDMPRQKRLDCLKIAAVVYRFIFKEESPRFVSLISLLGKDYSFMYQAASGYFNAPKRYECVKGDDDVTEADVDYQCRTAYLREFLARNKDEALARSYMALLSVYIHASPERNSEGNEMALASLYKFLSYVDERSSETSCIAEIGSDMCKSISELSRKAQDANNANNILLNGEFGPELCTILEYQEYASTANAVYVADYAMEKAGIDIDTIKSKVITKQMFREAQAAASQAIKFQKVYTDSVDCEGDDVESDNVKAGTVVMGGLEALMDDHTAYFDNKGKLVVDERAFGTVYEATRAYNAMLPLYLEIRILADAYSNEIKNGLARELDGIGSASQSNTTALLKTIEKLQNQIQKMTDERDSYMAVAEQTSKLLAQTRKKANALSVKLEQAEATIDELVERLPEEANDSETSDNLEVEEATAESIPAETTDYAKELDAVLDGKTVVIVGGNHNLMKKFRNLHPKASFVEKDDLATCDQQIRTADAVVYKIDSMSHALYRKSKSMAERYDVPCAYLPNVTSIARLEESLVKVLKDTFDA